MADYAILAADVQYGSATGVNTGIAGEAISAGDAICRLAADGKIYKADNDVATKAVLLGIAVNSAAAGQPVSWVAAGDVTVTAVFAAAGALVALSDTAGKFCPVADLVAPQRVVLAGWSKSTTVLHLNIVDTGVVLA